MRIELDFVQWRWPDAEGPDEKVSDERHKFWHCVMSTGRCVRACKRLSEAAKTLPTRDHVRGISGPSTLFNSVPPHRVSRYAGMDVSRVTLMRRGARQGCCAARAVIGC
jgi:hypothetical protein